MIKIMCSGDLHIGRRFDRYPDVRDRLIESRFECLQRIMETAEKEKCQFVVITGDTFDNVSSVRMTDVRRVAGILSGSAFSGHVLVLPGNHDYCEPGSKLWAEFRRFAPEVTLLDRYEPVTFSEDGKDVVFYPAMCDSKHSRENRIGWIKEADVDREAINIGVAHGAIAGITPDANGEYFLMTEGELESIPMDAWLIGHTHIPYAGNRVFNAGTPEQLDLHNNTPGLSFIVSVDVSENGRKRVSIERVKTGQICYIDAALRITPSDDLEEQLGNFGCDPESTVIRLKLTGSMNRSDYADRKLIYNGFLDMFLTGEIEDEEVSEEITAESIREEYPEESLASRVLNGLLDDPQAAGMARELFRSCKTK